jgi:hypothetical protein
MAYDKEKYVRIQVLLPIEYEPKLDIIRGRFKRSPYISDLVIKQIEEEEKKDPDKFK